MNRKIIIGYDPGERGDDALELGKVMAELLAAEVIVATVTAWPDNLMATSDLERALQRETAPGFTRATETLAGLPVETRAFARSSAAEVLNDLAEEEQASLLVLGSCHRGPLGRIALGSVGESLLQGAPCAIAVAPQGYAKRPKRQVLRTGVAFDGSPEAWTALETAIGFAERAHGELTIVTVAELPHYGYATSLSVLTSGEFHDYEKEEKRRLLDLALGRVPTGLVSEGRLLSGDAGALLEEVSGEFDLFIAGSRAYGPLRRTLLGSATRRLLRTAGCPVIVTPRGTGVDPLGLREPAEANLATGNGTL